MSRKDSQVNKILLDTSFLLPILGFETASGIMKAFEKLDTYILCYNEISILEALWKIVKVIKWGEDGVKRILEGIDAIRKTMDNITLDSEIVKNAIEMYRLGHRDMVDNLLYSIAVSKKLKFLTVDKDLIKFIEDHNLPREHIILPRDLQ